MLECIRQLVDVDKDWVPDNPKASLYIRPTMIGTEPSLGVSVSFYSTIKTAIISKFSHQLKQNVSLSSVQLAHTLLLVVSIQFLFTLTLPLFVLLKVVPEITKWAPIMDQPFTHI